MKISLNALKLLMAIWHGTILSEDKKPKIPLFTSCYHFTQTINFSTFHKCQTQSKILQNKALFSVLKMQEDWKGNVAENCHIVSGAIFDLLFYQNFQKISRVENISDLPTMGLNYDIFENISDLPSMGLNYDICICKRWSDISVNLSTPTKVLYN